MPQTKYPCFECTEKYDRCHATCQKYIDEKNRREEQKAPERNKAIVSQQVADLRASAYLKNKRKYHFTEH